MLGNPTSAPSAGSREQWSIDGFALGISASGRGDPEVWQREVEWVEHADAIGLHSVWVPEMHFTPGACATPLVTLASFAARTRALRLGTSSLLLPIHEPQRLADDITTLQQISGGRSLIGLGRGFRKPLFDAFGIDPKTKRDRFDIVLDTMLERWGQARPPLAVAAFGPKGLAQAAARGLPYLASPLESLALLCENRARHRELLPEPCDGEAMVVPVLRIAHVASDSAEAKRVLGAIEADSGRGRWRAPKAIARALEEPTEERVIVGTREAVEDRLARYRDELGLDLLIVHSQAPGAAANERLASLEILAEIAQKLASS